MGDLDLRGLLAAYGGPHGAWAPAMIALTGLGSGWAVFVLVPMLWHPGTRRFAGALGVAVATQAVLVWAVKLMVGRVRPWIALGLPAPVGAPSDGSFPSGHAAGAFCVAVFVAAALPVGWRESTGRAWAVRVAILTVAALIALSRVYLGAHFPSDVAAGALVGAAIGGVAASLHVMRGAGVEEAAKRR